MQDCICNSKIIEDDVWIGANTHITLRVIIFKELFMYSFIPPLKILMKQYKVVFWDFDGVIKETIDVKTKAFIELFKSYDIETTTFVKQHHEANGGMSRFDKFPIYLALAGEEVTLERINDLSNKFSNLIFNDVINSNWVDGAEEYLRINPFNQKFVLVTATPNQEINKILKALNLSHVFMKVYGSPAKKNESIKITMETLNITQDNCVMIGDALVDFEAAKENKIQFILRMHNSNKTIFSDYNGLSINNITELL